MQVRYKGTEYDIPDAHPAANCLPWHLDKPEFAELIHSVRDGYDLDKPILQQAGTGLIISGRRRALACVIADVDPEVKEVDWDDDAVMRFVRRDEIIRRNLTEGERVMAVAELSKLRERGGDRRSDDFKVSADTLKSTDKTIAEIAEEAGVSKATANRAVKVKKKSPELAEAVKEGKLKVRTAAAVADLPKATRKKVAESDNPAAAAKIALAKSRKPEPVNQPDDAETDSGTDEQLDPVEQLAARARQVNEMFRSLCAEIDRVNERIVGMKGVPEARWVSWDVCRDNLRQVRNSIYQATLQSDPYCNGTGRVDDEPCSACKGFGHVPKRVAKACPTREAAA